MIQETSQPAQQPNRDYSFARDTHVGESVLKNKRSGQINEEFIRLSASIDGTNAILAELSKKISPVCFVIPTPRTDCERPSEPEVCGLAHSIRAQRQKLEAINIAAAALCEAIQL